MVKMMKNVLVGAVVSLLIAGCAMQPQKTWYKEGITEEQFSRDQISCRQYGMASGMANGLAGNMFVATWVRDETEKCLRNFGYDRQ